MTNPLELVSTKDLVRELVRRTSACVVAYQHYEEPDNPTTSSVIDGNFVHVDGLVDLLQYRAITYREDKIERLSEGWEDED